MSRRILAWAAVAFLVAVVAACTSSTGPSASPTTSAATSASAPASESASRSPIATGSAALYGRYIATIPPGVNAQPGKWTLAVSESGVTFSGPGGQSFSPGAVEELTSNEFVLAPDPGCPVQEGTPTEGRYRWSREGDALMLEVVADSCQDRIDTFTTSEWSLIP
ncbi:MAG: hypothetical protein ABWX92_17350 [Mycetocola sp.]